MMMNRRTMSYLRHCYVYKVGTGQLPIAGGARQSRNKRFAAVQEKQVPDNILECIKDLATQVANAVTPFFGK